MSFLGNLVDGLRVRNNDDSDDQNYLDEDYNDDYADDGDYDYDEEEDNEPESRGGFFSNFSKRSSKSGDEQPSRFGGIGSRKVVPIQSSGMKVTMKRPRALNDSRAICDDLLDGKAVVINLEGVDGSLAQRIIDFTLGSVYSIEGDLQQISSYIFIASPHSIELSGEFKGDFSKNYAKSEQPVSRAVVGGYGF